MKLVLSLYEVKQIIANHVGASRLFGSRSLEPQNINFIHKYADGSGEEDVELVAAIDRIEVDC